MTLYDVGASWEVAGVDGAVNWGRRHSSRSRRSSNLSRRSSNRSSNRSSRSRGDGSRRIRIVGCDCRFGSVRVKAASVTASVAVVVVVVVVATGAATVPAVDTPILLGAAVNVVLKVCVIQTAPTASSRAAQM